ncbi:MAG: YceI family protein [Crocinitomicaceae bacterium]
MKNILILSFILVATLGFTQEIKTKEAHITFFSEKESIKAENSEVESTLDVSNGTLTFIVAIEKFIFPNGMMQKHFNQEGVMNSVSFPKANFEGTITNNDQIDYTTDGEYPVEVKGKMSIKGVSKEILVKGNIVIKNGQISAQSVFSLDRFEYGVDTKKESVSQILEITVKADYK